MGPVGSIDGGAFAPQASGAPDPNGPSGLPIPSAVRDVSRRPCSVGWTSADGLGPAARGFARRSANESAEMSMPGTVPCATSARLLKSQLSRFRLSRLSQLISQNYILVFQYGIFSGKFCINTMRFIKDVELENPSD